MNEVLRIGGMFTGVGAHHSAVSRLGIGKVIYQAEIDEKTARAYDLMHGETKNLGDVTQIESLTDDLRTDILIWSPPCQDISRSNRKAKGNARGSGTRSSLAFEVPRILANTPENERPQYMIMEEVKDMTSKRYKGNFDELLNELGRLGYASRYATLNAKDYGIAQSRERVYVISSLHRIPPEFPAPVPLKTVMNDYLDSGEIPDKYYLRKERVEGMILSTEKESARGNKFRFEPTDGDVIAKTITARAGTRKTDNYLIDRPRQIGELQIKGYDCTKRVWSKDACSPTIVTGTGGNTQVKILCDQTRVRKLTPSECYRLMGFDQDEIDSVLDWFSDSVHYQLAGNSICVPVLTAILKQIYEDTQRGTRDWEF